MELEGEGNEEEKEKDEEAGRRREARTARVGACRHGSHFFWA